MAATLNIYGSVEYADESTLSQLGAFIGTFEVAEAEQLIKDAQRTLESDGKTFKSFTSRTGVWSREDLDRYMEKRPCKLHDSLKDFLTVVPSKIKYLYFFMW